MRQVLEANALALVPGYTAGGKSGTAYVPTVATRSTSGDAYAVGAFEVPAALYPKPKNVMLRIDSSGAVVASQAFKDVKIEKARRTYLAYRTAS